MANAGGGRRNGAVWAGFALGFAAALTNAVFLVPKIPGQRAMPWVSLWLGAAALIFLAVGLRRAFGEPLVYRGKALSVILAVIALLPAGASVWLFFHARAVPASAGAPHVGQTAPDFTLTDTAGKAVSLAQLLGPATGGATAADPIINGVTNGITNGATNGAAKAVLLVFYRGYW